MRRAARSPRQPLSRAAPSMRTLDPQRQVVLRNRDAMDQHVVPWKLTAEAVVRDDARSAWHLGEAGLRRVDVAAVGSPTQAVLDRSGARGTLEKIRLERVKQVQALEASPSDLCQVSDSEARAMVHAERDRGLIRCRDEQRVAF